MVATKGSPSTASETTVRRRGRSVLDVVIFAGLLGAVGDFTVPQLLEGRIIPPPLVFAVAYLVCAGVVATGWRWSMLIPLSVGLLSLPFELGTGFPQYALTHPSQYLTFATFVLHFPLILLTVGACIVKLLQTVRHQPPHAPQWMTPAVTALAGLAIGALLVGAIAQPSAGGSSTTGAAGTEAVHLTADRFAPDIVALHTGDTLTLIDDAPVPHILTNGAWSADNRPMPGVEPGAPTVNNVALNNNSTTIGPFATPGAYHIYCTVHPGMTLTIIVQ